MVVCVFALLVLISASALAHSQTSSDRARCANNLRRLMLAWQMYPDDYAGLVMAAGESSGNQWVSGWLDYSPGNSDNTNTVYLTNAAYAAIGPYVSSSLLFRCPADPTTLVLNGVPKLRVRSYSMNGSVGPSGSAFAPNYQAITRMTEVSQPDRIFVLLEEHPGSINDPSFYIDTASVGGNAKIVDFPGHFHLGGANLGMADGHIEYWQWSDARTMPPMTGGVLALNVPSPNNPDVARLQSAVSYPK